VRPPPQSDLGGFLNGQTGLGDFGMPDEQREYLEELAWENREAKALRLRLLTVISRLPAPDRDVLRAYVSTSLPVDVHAVLLRMPGQAFCERLLSATEQVLALLAAEDELAPATALTTRTAHPDRRSLPARRAAAEVA
jgi:hypothetical protein